MDFLLFLQRNAHKHNVVLHSKLDSTMGMNLLLNSIKDSDIDLLVKDPILIEILECEEINIGSVNIDLKYGVKPENVYLYSNWKPLERVETLNIEGAFISLDYLLTGRGKTRSQYPFNFLTENYRVITNMYAGPVNVFYAREVKDIVNALSSIEQSVLIEEFDEEHYNDKKIYPRHYTWTKDDIYDMLEQVKSIITFLKNAANNGKGIYIIIS